LAAKHRFLEKKQRFSESILWNLQSEAYCQFGPEAWSYKGVPFYLTSNPYTAKQYVSVVIGYLRDCLKSNSATPLNISQPIYIFDLGAGTGRFGFLFLKELLEILESIWDFKLDIRYVMTDIAYRNIAFWQQHPYLEKYIKRGILDFAYYYHGMSEDQPIKLILSHQELTPSMIHNPIILIANYFFDTIPQDLFRIKEGKLQEGQISISVKPSKETERLGPEDPKIIEHLECHYDYVPITKADYYSDPQLNKLLAAYLNQFNQATFLFPVGAFQSIRYFSFLSRQRLLLLAGDQGVSTKEQVEAWGEPKVSRHGSFSIAVSYHAIAHFFKQCLGAGLLTTFSDPLFVVMAGIFGGVEEEYGETCLAFKDSLDRFEPQDYWNIVNAIENKLDSFPLGYLLKLIRLGNWDPINFNAFFDTIRKKIPEASEALKKELGIVIHQVWEHFYPVSSDESGFILNLGVLFYELKKYQEALLFFQRSLNLSGEKASTLMNMAACYLAMKNQKAAQECFRRAKEPESKHPDRSFDTGSKSGF